MGKKAKSALPPVQPVRVTYIDPVKIRYNGSTPSMSRRGGVRLNPVTDGIIDHQRHMASVLRRDNFGAKLIDVVNPTTGMFSHVRSNLHSTPTNPVGCSTMKSGVSGSPNAETRDGDYRVRVARKGQHAGRKVYTDEQGRVVRTTDMGEEPLPLSVVSAPTKPVKERAVRPARASKSAKPTVPGGTGSNGSITRDDIEAFIRAVAASRGQTVTVFTENMIRDGREALKIRRKQAQQHMRRAAASAAQASSTAQKASK